MVGRKYWNSAQALNALYRFWREQSYRRIGKPEQYMFGSAKFLIAAEKHFGGYVDNISRRKISDHDPRLLSQISKEGMKGGDRMFHHRYAETYSAALKPFFKKYETKMTIVEIGILKGTGLALWSLLFPHGRIIGLDIDISHTRDNLENLKARGGFEYADPELYEFDQLTASSAEIGKLLGSDKINICVDDGLHSELSIRLTAKAVYPHLSNKAVYFIEDKDVATNALKDWFPGANFSHGKKIAVIKFGL